MSDILENWEYFIQKFNNGNTSDALTEGKLYWNVHFETNAGIKNLSNNTISANPNIYGSNCIKINDALSISSGNIEGGTYKLGTNSYIELVNVPIEPTYRVSYNVYDFNTKFEYETSYDIFEKISELTGLRKENYIFLGLTENNGNDIGFILLKPPAKQKISNPIVFGKTLISTYNALGYSENTYTPSPDICASEVLDSSEYVLGFINFNSEKEYEYSDNTYYYKNTIDTETINKINFSIITSDSRKLLEQDRINILKNIDVNTISTKLLNKLSSKNIRNEVLYPLKTNNTIINVAEFTKQSPLTVTFEVIQYNNVNNINCILSHNGQILHQVILNKNEENTNNYSIKIKASGFNNYITIDNFTETILNTNILPVRNTPYEPIIQTSINSVNVTTNTTSLSNGEALDIEFINVNTNPNLYAIKYTLDGSTPTIDSQTYISKVSIHYPKQYIIKAYLFEILNPNNISVISTKRLTILSKLKKPTFETNVAASSVNYPAYPTPNSRDEYTISSGTLEVKILSSILDSTIYYTLNGDTPDINNIAHTYVYNTGDVIKLKHSTEINAIEVASNYESSDVASTYFYVKYINTANPPTITNSNVSTYNNYFDLVLTSPYSNAIIYYTLDGSTPNSSSSVYTGPIAVTPINSNTLIVNAINSVEDYNDSTVATKTFNFNYVCNSWMLRRSKSFPNNAIVEDNSIKIYSESEIIRTIPLTGSYYIDFNILEFIGEQSLSVSFDTDRKDINYYGDKNYLNSHPHYFPLISKLNESNILSEIALGVQNEKYNFNNFNVHGVFDWNNTSEIQCRFIVKNTSDIDSTTIFLNDANFSNNVFKNQHRDYILPVEYVGRNIVINNLKSDITYFIYMPHVITTGLLNDVVKIFVEQSDVKIHIRNIVYPNTVMVSGQYEPFGLNKIDELLDVTDTNIVTSASISITDNAFIINETGKYVFRTIFDVLLNDYNWRFENKSNTSRILTENVQYTALILKQGNSILKTRWNPVYDNQYGKIVISVYGTENRSISNNNYVKIGNITGKCGLSSIEIERYYKDF